MGWTFGKLGAGGQIQKEPLDKFETREKIKTTTNPPYVICMHKRCLFLLIDAILRGQPEPAIYLRIKTNRVVKIYK